MKYLMMIEVSQKQAYIFSSTKLQDNIRSSEEICQVTSVEYYSQMAQEDGIEFSKEKNLVYSGGGHIILEFSTKEQAEAFSFALSRRVQMDFPKMELFIKTTEYNEHEDPGENLINLTNGLERKKSVRRAVFHQGTFGVEKLDTTTRRAKESILNKKMGQWVMAADIHVPDGYKVTNVLENLGGKKNESNFIAIVHIDGNAMGKRVEELREQHKNDSWCDYKKVFQNFSESIDCDFKKAYEETLDCIVQNLNNGLKDKLDLKDKILPIRKIILAGDDVCFVTEGRIGLEAARIFIEKLCQKTNTEDQKKYTACAGVAIVHQKYPFYKAYELAEMLCSSAKKYIATFNNGTEQNAAAKACAIDWHIEFGEVMDSLTEMRQKYDTADGNRLELRPYLLSAEDEILKQERVRRYDNFKKMMHAFQTKEFAYAKGKLKELRNALKEGENAANYFMINNMLDELRLVGNIKIYEDLTYDKLFSGEGLQRKSFVETNDGKKRALFFDAIELLDTYIELE